MSETEKWEYRVFTWGSAWKANKDEDLEALLNEWGIEGWEVVSAQHGLSSEKIRVIAKRPLTRANRRERTWPG